MTFFYGKPPPRDLSGAWGYNLVASYNSCFGCYPCNMRVFGLPWRKKQNVTYSFLTPVIVLPKQRAHFVGLCLHLGQFYGLVENSIATLRITVVISVRRSAVMRTSEPAVSRILCYCRWLACRILWNHLFFFTVCKSGSQVPPQRTLERSHLCQDTLDDGRSDGTAGGVSGPWWYAANKYMCPSCGAQSGIIFHFVTIRPEFLDHLHVFMIKMTPHSVADSLCAT